MKSSTAEVLPEGIASVFHTSEPACSLINTERCRRGGQYPLLEGYESAARFSALLSGTSPVRDDDAVTELEAWCLCVTMLPPAGRIEYLTAFISLLRDDTAVRERQADAAENICVCLEKLRTDPHFRALMKGLCRLSRS